MDNYANRYFMIIGDLNINIVGTKNINNDYDLTFIGYRNTDLDHYIISKCL